MPTDFIFFDDPTNLRPLLNYNLINIPSRPIFTPPYPIFPYPTNIPDSYYIKARTILNNTIYFL